MIAPSGDVCTTCGATFLQIEVGPEPAILAGWILSDVGVS